MERNGTRNVMLAAALLLGATALSASPGEVEAAVIRVPLPPTNLLLYAAPANGTDYTMGYDPTVRAMDGTLLGSGPEPNSGDTGKLVAGQFGWIHATVTQNIDITSNEAGFQWLGNVQIAPGLGWFMAIDRDPVATGRDSDLRDPDSEPDIPDATWAPLAEEGIGVTMSGTGSACPPAVTTPFDMLEHATYEDKRTLLEVTMQTTDDNGHDETGGRRHDRFIANVGAHVGIGSCQLAITYKVDMYFAFDTSRPTPSSSAFLSEFGPEVQNLRIWVGLPSLSSRQLAMEKSTLVNYTPVVLVKWACTGRPVPPPADCAETVLAAMPSGGPRNVAFPAPGGGWYTLNGKVGSAGSVQGALTYVPDPYSSYQVTRTKLVTRDHLGYYNEVQWPAMSATTNA